MNYYYCMTMALILSITSRCYAKTSVGWMTKSTTSRRMISSSKVIPAFYVPNRSASSTSSLSSTSSVSSVDNIMTKVVGDVNTESFRLQYHTKDTNTLLSPWHDIPYKNDDGTYNMIVEIPKMTKAKMEVSTKELSNPIAQDIKKGKLRDYHGPLYWNYGCIPQTWENPNVKHPELLCFGDNDPIDVIEIGTSALTMGSVVSIKLLGVIAMIDDGELDWKVLAINNNDPLYDEYNNIDDVPLYVQDGIREWFRWYKTPDDKPLNEFGYNEAYLDASTAEEVIHETHDAWKQLIDGTIDSGKLWIK